MVVRHAVLGVADCGRVSCRAIVCLRVAKLFAVTRVFVGLLSNSPSLDSLTGLLLRDYVVAQA
jgi:hypothetical protein